MSGLLLMLERRISLTVFSGMHPRPSARRWGLHGGHCPSLPPVLPPGRLTGAQGPVPRGKCARLSALPRAGGALAGSVPTPAFEVPGAGCRGLSRWGDPGPGPARLCPVPARQGVRSEEVLDETECRSGLEPSSAGSRCVPAADPRSGYPRCGARGRAASSSRGAAGPCSLGADGTAKEARLLVCPARSRRPVPASRSPGRSGIVSGSVLGPGVREGTLRASPPSLLGTRLVSPRRQPTPRRRLKAQRGRRQFGGSEHMTFGLQLSG